MLKNVRARDFLICFIGLLAIAVPCHLTGLIWPTTFIGGDGTENLKAALNIVGSFVFSSSSPSIPDMFREPVWPVITSILLKLFGLDELPYRLLIKDHGLFFRLINVFFYTASIYLATWFVYRKNRRYGVVICSLLISIIVYGGIPRLINYFNNEALATILLLVGSIIFKETVNGSLSSSNRIAPVFLGVVLGLLALTKAQYLYICLPLFVVMFFIDKKKSIIALVLFFTVVSPWIARNYYHFGELAIAQRGKTVLAVRVVLTAEPTSQEHSCMAFAFTNPLLQSTIGHYLGIKAEDFSEGKKCQRLNRELCFDMGSTKITCRPFTNDIEAKNWRNKTQFFYRGYSAGPLLERGQLRLSDIANFDLLFLKKYVQSLPLFMWRGFSFGNHHLVSILVSISLFLLLFTNYWPFVFLAISSHLFHVLITHNIPRYHVVEFPIMIFSTVFLLDLLQAYLIKFTKKRQLYFK